jgi:4-hydroxy-3-methylbut-2-en-1-yl diphosphate synthase IspG/GcpE
MVEYVACPSCGRTLFNLENVLHQVREATKHLTGLDIAVMGCIVNGPGEMADADYGYVGSGVGKITLYKGKEVMMRQGTEAVQKEGLEYEFDLNTEMDLQHNLYLNHMFVFLLLMKFCQI